MDPLIRAIQRSLLLAVALLSILPTLAMANSKVRFDIPESYATIALKQFAQQARLSIVYDTRSVEEVRTNDVVGLLTPVDALKRLLEGTPLQFSQDRESGAIAVNRAAAPPEPAAQAPLENQNNTMKNQQPTEILPQPQKPTLLSAARATLAALIAVSSSVAQTDSSDEIFELTPFVVSEDDNVGYSANSTLAGTRLNTQLRDIGASISIITPELMNDLAATDASTLLAYTVGTEVGGISGNFAGGATTSGRPDQSAARENPGENQRVRGIGPAANTRSFFLTDIAFDSYNTSRVTINRGPNSLLFGIGNPAGVIDASLVNPILSRNQSEITTRFGSNDSWRVTLDHNQVLIEDRLAIRIAAKNQNDKFDQKPAYSNDRRIYITAESILRNPDSESFFGKTTLRGSFESGVSDSNPVNVVPPTDSYSILYNAPNPALDDLPGVNLHPTVLQGGPGYIWQPGVTIDNRVGASTIPQNAAGYYREPYYAQIPIVFDSAGQTNPGYSTSTNPALAGIAGVMGRMEFTPAINGRPGTIMVATGPYTTNLPGFSVPSIQDRNVFDYRNQLLAGDSGLIEGDFSAKNVALVQELFARRGGFEFAYDEQSVESFRSLPFSFGENGGPGMSDIFIDVSEYLGNDEPNPNLGRPFILQSGNQDRLRNLDRKSARFTAFYELDLQEGRRIPLGKHTITGLYTTQEIDSYTENYQIGWGDSETRDTRTTIFRQNLGQFKRTPVLVQYIGPSVLGATSLNPLKVTDVFDSRIPQDGDSYDVTFYQWSPTREVVTDSLPIRRFLNGASRSRQEVESQSASVKSDFFNGNLVGIVGWRTDQLKTFANEGTVRLASGAVDPASAILRSDPELDEEVSSFTWSVIGHLPQRLDNYLPKGMDLSAYYNESGNFNPTAVNTDLNGEIIPAAAGDTKEYGFLLEFLERRGSLRVNWFETNQSNTRNDAMGATSGVFGLPNFLIGRYVAGEKAGIPFANIPGVTAAGYTSYSQMYSALMQLLPEPTNTLKNFRFDENGDLLSDGVLGLNDITNLSAKGMEIELVGNLTSNWRVSFNVAKQETVLSDTAGLTKEVADHVYAQLVKLNLLGVDQAPDSTERITVAERFSGNVATRLASALARDGAPSLEQRKWRANLVTTYDFHDTDIGWLKNFSVGTAMRWQDKAAIGNPFLTGERLKQKIVEVDPNFSDTSQIADSAAIMQSQFPDLENPFFAPEEWAADMWIGYRRTIARDIDWRLQLNVSNAWGTGDDIPVGANPDGSISIIRIPNETRWYLTSKFKF